MSENATQLTAARMFTVSDVAKMINKSEQTTRKMARLGLIPGARRMGRDWRFRHSEINKFVGI